MVGTIGLHRYMSVREDRRGGKIAVTEPPALLGVPQRPDLVRRLAVECPVTGEIPTVDPQPAARKGGADR